MDGGKATWNKLQCQLNFTYETTSMLFFLHLSHLIFKQKYMITCIVILMLICNFLTSFERLLQCFRLWCYLYFNNLDGTIMIYVIIKTPWLHIHVMQFWFKMLEPLKKRWTPPWSVASWILKCMTLYYKHKTNCLFLLPTTFCLWASY